MELAMFGITAAIALIGGLGMLLSRNGVHSALFLLLNFFAVSVLFLMLQSPFLFAIQLTVYAGAIMVLFLFVVMLLGSERVEDSPDRLSWQRWVALGLAVVLLAESIIVGLQVVPVSPPSDVAEMEAFVSPTSIGEALFTKYLLPFEVTGVLLLVAIVGVVVIQQRARARDDQAMAEKIATSATNTET